jgi:dUTP diphosphatase
MTAAVEVLLLQLDAGLEPPSYAHPDDAGADLRSTESFELQPGERRLVGTGVAISLPLCTRTPGWPPGTGSAS